LERRHGSVYVAPEDNRGQAGNAPRESEELYRLLAENSTEIISKHMPEGMYTYVSPACRSLLGYEPEELVGRFAHELFHPEDLEQIRGTHFAMLERPDVYTVVNRIRRKDGSYGWFETTSRTVRDPETGEVLEIIAVSRDATEHKRSEEALRKSEEFHRFAVEAGRIGTWDLDPQSEECLISPKMAELMDYPPDQMAVPSAQWWGSIVPDDRTAMASALAASIESDAPFDLEFRIALKDGTERWLYSRGGVSRNPWGKATRLHGASIDITERKRAEEALKESSRRIENILESIAEEFFAVDREWRLTYINERAVSRLRKTKGAGLTREGLLGKNIWEEFPQLVGTVFYEKYHEALREQQTVHFETQSPLSDTCFEVHAYPSEEGLSIYAQDVTERKRAEEALRESEERYRTLFDSIDEGFAIIEMLYDERGRAVDYRILETNPAFERMTGFADAAGKTSLELNPDAEPHWFETLGRVAQTGEDVRFENYAEALDRWFDVYASRVGSDDSRRVAIVFANTTKRKRAEEALRESEERYRAFFETAAVGAAEADPSTGRFLRVNDNLCKLLGYSRDELLTTTFFKITHPDDRAHSSEGMNRLLRGEIREYVTEKRCLRKDGEIVWVQLAVALVRDRGGRPLHSIAIMQDITERKRVEEALAEVLRARTHFMADVSHELRTPLTVIRGNAEVGLELGREGVHGEVLEEIVRESGSLSRMVEDLLFLARSDSDALPLDREIIPVARLLGGLAERAEALTRKHGTSFETMLSGEGSLWCDAQRIEQAVLILVDNAVKYGPPGELIALSSATRQDELLIEVSDRGPGIPPEELPRIFERFYRGEDPPEEPGSGLGLAINLPLIGDP
jgi:PAS domain S-box-containing protein